MNFPSTNTDGANPAAGDVLSNVESSHGVRLTGGSTGGVVMPAGDDANIAITLVGKGTGATQLGNSSSPVQFGQTFVVQFTPAELAASAASQSTIAVPGLAAGRPLLFTVTSPALSGVYAFRAQCSTAAELRLTQQNISGSSIGTGQSTSRGILIQL